MVAWRIDCRCCVLVFWVCCRCCCCCCCCCRCWCSPCRAEEPILSALAKKYQQVAFVGILTRDNPVNAEAFVRKRESAYPTLIDDSVLIGFAKTLPANAIPTTIVIDKQGKVAGRISGAVTYASLSSLIEKVLEE